MDPVEEWAATQTEAEEAKAAVHLTAMEADKL